MTDKMRKDDFLSLFISKYLRVNDGGKEKRRIISDYSKKLMTDDGCRMLKNKAGYTARQSRTIGQGP